MKGRSRSVKASVSAWSCMDRVRGDTGKLNLCEDANGKWFAATLHPPITYCFSSLHWR